MTRAQFLGHSCVLLQHGSHRLIIDPFITGNPHSPVEADQVDVQYVLVTHGHGDHVGDAISIAKRNHATIIANFELSMLCQRYGCKVHPMHIGGGHNFDFGRVKLTIAHHGSGYGDNADVYTGPPVGFLITFGSKTVYHSGDTGLFYDMKLIGEINNIDLAFLPIGDNFTMGIDDAVKAVEFLRPKSVVPFHYSTFPVIDASPGEFALKVGERATVKILRPGEHIDF